MRVGDEYHFERAITLFDHLVTALDHRAVVHGLVDRSHVAEAQVRVNLDAIMGLATEQAPDRYIELLAPDVPQRHLDAADRRVADHAQAPEGMLHQHAQVLLDVARIAADQHRLQILHRADDRARLPLERCLAPAVESRLVGLDTYEYPVAHLGVADRCPDRADFHCSPPKGERLKPTRA